MEPKAVLRRYLDVAHEALVWKLEGLSEYDVRRPLTPTGTNLLGIVKHVAWVELGYFGDVFSRPHSVEPPDNADEVHLDMYAGAHETRSGILELLAQARAHAWATIDELDLDAEGHVPWWGDANPVTLQWIVVHMATEIHRHLGQVDILREQLDGQVGMREGSENMPEGDADYWAAHCDRLERLARDTRV